MIKFSVLFAFIFSYITFDTDAVIIICFWALVYYHGFDRGSDIKSNPPLSNKFIVIANTTICTFCLYMISTK